MQKITPLCGSTLRRGGATFYVSIFPKVKELKVAALR